MSPRDQLLSTVPTLPHPPLQARGDVQSINDSCLFVAAAAAGTKIALPLPRPTRGAGQGSGCICPAPSCCLSFHPVLCTEAVGEGCRSAGPWPLTALLNPKLCPLQAWGG